MAENREPVVEPGKRFEIEYATVNAYVLHYSNVRSALASFLITVALAAFGGYYGTQKESVGTSSFLGVDGGAHILWVAGFLFLVAAIGASLYFSFYTERATEYTRRLWRWGVEGTAEHPGGFRGTWNDVNGQRLDDDVRRRQIWRRVEQDPMNWLLILGALALALCFVLFEMV